MPERHSQAPDRHSALPRFADHARALAQFYVLRRRLGAIYFRYCSSLTCSIHSTGFPFSAS
jgi:hypothetical protein